jgi:hypothetical protein
VRPSTRVFTKPDSLNIFDNSPVVQPHIRCILTVNCDSRRDPNESSLSAANSRPGTGRHRDPNERSGSSGMVGQSDEGVHTGKKMTHGVNASHFSISDSDVQGLGDDMDQMMLNKKHVSGSTKSHFTLAPTGSPAHVSTLHKKQVVDNPNYVSHWKIDGKGGDVEEYVSGKKMGGGPGSQGEEAWHYGKKIGGGPGVRERRHGTLGRRLRLMLCRLLCLNDLVRGFWYVGKGLMVGAAWRDDFCVYWLSVYRKRGKGNIFVQLFAFKSPFLKIRKFLDLVTLSLARILDLLEILDLG